MDFQNNPILKAISNFIGNLGGGEKPTQRPVTTTASGGTVIGTPQDIKINYVPNNRPFQPPATPIPTGAFGEKGAQTVIDSPPSSPVPPEIEKIAQPIFQKYGIPDQVGFGQFAQEGHGKHKYAQAPYNNPYNLGAYDRNPDGAFQYPSLEKGIEAYAKLLSGQYELGHIGSGKFDTKYAPAYALKDNPEEMLKQIAKIGYASDPNYVQNITNTPEYRYYANKK